MTKVEYHQLWLEAHYALGKHEATLGHTLTRQERSKFIRNHIAKSAKSDPGKIDP